MRDRFAREVRRKMFQDGGWNCVGKSEAGVSVGQFAAMEERR
jgi:hypothetical protein